MTKTLRMMCVCAAAVASMAVLAAQSPTAQDGATRPASQDAVLHIAVVSGEGATHAPGEHVAKPVTVQVTDGTGQPVEGARVSFQVPREGPGGVLSSGLGTDLGTTDADGRATVRSLQLNRIAGRYLIRVTAAKDQARAGIVLPQFITERNSVREIADRTAPPAAPDKALPAAASPAPPPVQPNSAPLETAPNAPIPLQKAREPKALTAAIRAARAPAQASEEAAPPGPPRIPTIVITQGSRKPVAGAISGVYTAHQGKSHKKWIWLGLLAAGGVGGAFAGSSMGATAAHNSATAAAVTAGVSIGTPTFSIGKP
jgi:hypothetical protein